MQYCDALYITLFLPIVIIMYQILKNKRGIVLLLASYIFFFLTSKKLLIYIILSTICIYFIGKLIDKNQSKEKIELEKAKKDDKKAIKNLYVKKNKRILLLGIIIQLVMITMTKYLGFFCDNINLLLKAFHLGGINAPKFLAPLGISFYTFMAISYLVDVYRGKIKADKNIGKLALYLSFFPAITEGPISRFEEIGDSLWKGEKIHYKNLCFGYQRIVYGLIKKMVIADRLNMIVKVIFDKYTTFDGGILFAGVILYTIQLYMDFSGIMDVACGTGEIFNVNLPENFRQPFFSKNISEFWSRWHITLGTWFKDYIYYPISLSKLSKNLTKKLRPKIGSHFGPMVAGTIALFAVWSLNGLWHGAGYTYLLFGMYHFVFISLGNIFEPLFVKIYNKLKINRESIIVKGFRIFKTIIIVLFGEMIFRANNVESIGYFFKNIFTNFSLKGLSNNTLLNYGLDSKDYILMLITFVVILVFDILREKHISVREKIASKPIVIRWTLYLILIFFLIIFAAYGGKYAPVDPMYANF